MTGTKSAIKTAFEARDLNVRLDRPPTAAEFHQLASVPAEAEWFANLDNPHAPRVPDRSAGLHGFCGDPSGG